MSFENIQTLSMNSHFYGLLFQSFLSGYNKPCEIRLVFMALPILLYSESRIKLATAKTTSKMETLFNTPQILENDMKISGKVSLAGYLKRYDELKSCSKKALIVLYSEKKMVLSQSKIILVELTKYSKFNGTVRQWIKAAYYLGVVFAKTSEDHLNYFLGVDRQ